MDFCQRGNIFDAAWHGHLRYLKEILESGEQQGTTSAAGVNARDTHQRSPLHLACMNGHLAAVMMLIEHGAQVNCTDAAGLTPLHQCASNGHLSCARYLVERSQANPIMKSAHKGYTPRHLAKINGRYELVHFFSTVESKIEGKYFSMN